MPRSRFAALCWTIFVVILHAIPRSGFEKVPGGAALIQTTVLDKVTHAVLFGIFAWLWGSAYPRRMTVILACGLAFGAALEVMQEAVVVGRSGSLIDALADYVGLALGAGAFKLFRKKDELMK